MVTKTDTKTLKATGAKRRRAGFTLIELLTVVTIIAFVLAMGAMGINTSIRSAALLSSSESLANYLQLGVQLAVKENRPIELRFYKLADPDDGQEQEQFRAYQFVARNPIDGSVEPLESVRRFSGGVIFHPNPEYSTILSLPENSADSGDPQVGEITDYKYISFEFRPDGSTTLPKDGQWSLTMVRESNIEGGAGSELPSNYRAVTLNAYNGTVRVY